jgi:hypothetical protein
MSEQESKMLINLNDLGPAAFAETTMSQRTLNIRKCLDGLTNQYTQLHRISRCLSFTNAAVCSYMVDANLDQKHLCYFISRNLPKVVGAKYAKLWLKHASSDLIFTWNEDFKEQTLSLTDSLLVDCKSHENLVKTADQKLPAVY